MYPYILRGDSLTIMINNRQHSLKKGTHPNFDKVIETIKAGEWDKVEDLVDLTKPIQKVLTNSQHGHGIEVKDGDVYYNGKPFHNALSKRLLDMIRQGFPVEPLCAFLENLKQNPSKRAVDQLYGFLEKNNLPITPDGHFLAYKRVRGNFMDIHSGKFDNSPGKVCEMPRNEVDEDPDQTCSTGLHFCSLEYLPHFGASADNRVVILKINPRDVVSIPSDYNNAKGRACRYEVVAEHGSAQGKTTDVPEAFDTVVKDTRDYISVTSSMQQLRNEVTPLVSSTTWNGNVQWRYAAGTPNAGLYATKADIEAWKAYKGL